MEQPTRTLLLLRSWALWRARLCGWAKERPGRQREADKQARQLTDDVVEASRRGEPLLGSEDALVLFRKWAPDVLDLANSRIAAA